EANGFNRLKFMVGDILDTFTRDFVDKHGKADVVILDPPRSGTLMEIKKAIVYAEPETVIYLSCNPVSLAWDLKFLGEFYDVKELWPYDMFPNTHHVETLALLKKKR
ncbi:MAG TPA: 23S rRNA (uracil-5-)-methyltransferase RumA, partial [Bacteroidales bacterium]